jgi:hypothetical protein
MIQKIKYSIIVIYLLFVGMYSISFANPAPVVLYNTFGENDSYQGIAYNIQNYSGDYIWDYAVKFSVSSGQYSLDQYILALKKRAADNSLWLELRNDEAGIPGNSVIERIHITDYPVDIPYENDMPPPIVVLSSLKPLLSPGNTYWVHLSAAPAYLGDNYWGLNSINAKGVFAQRDTLNSHMQWRLTSEMATLPAMRLIGVPVPEPATFVNAVLFLVAAVAFRKFRIRNKDLNRN